MKPLKKLKDVTIFDLDRAKCMPLAISIGYRYLPSPSLPTKNRLEPVAEFHVPVKGPILLSDRNRLDLDWWSGRFSPGASVIELSSNAVSRSTRIC